MNHNSIPHAPAHAPPPVDFFLLVLQYAPALCTDGTYKCPTGLPAGTYFTLHGLWPERADGSYPATCTNDKFNPSAVQPIMSELNTYWPSLNGPSNTFWAHEYEKHGTCAQDVLPTEFDFFNTTLSIRNAYDVTPALAKAGISPSASATFTKAAFQNAVTTAFGYPVLVECDSAGAITGATVCIDKNTFKARSCGSVTYGVCNSQTLKLLPLTGSHLRG